MFPPITPFGQVKAYAYISSDGNTYQVGVPEYLAAVGAGDLSPADPTDLPYCALWVTRYLACKKRLDVLGEPATGSAHVPCNEFHPAWLQGPGTSIYILGSEYVVVACVGERRHD